MNKKIKRLLSLTLAFAMVFTMIAVAVPLKTSAGSAQTAADLKDGYDVKLTYSYTGFGGDIDKNVTVQLDGKLVNGTDSSSSLIWNDTGRFYEKTPAPIWGWVSFLLWGIVGYETISGTHYDSSTTTQKVSYAFPSQIKATVHSGLDNAGAVKETINYVVTVNGQEVLNDAINFNKFNNEFSLDVPQSAYPYIESAFISVDKNEVTVGNDPQYVQATATFGDQYDVKWTANTNAAYSIVDANGDALTIPGVSVDDTGKVEVTKDAANDGDRTFFVKVTANGKSAISEAVTIKTPVYTATFVADGQTVGQPITFIIGTTAITEPLVPAKDGYTGVWETYTLGTADITINAVYTINSYTVTFEDGYTTTPIDTQTVEHGNAATAPTAPTRSGYNFAGWDVAFDNITGDTVVTATWTQQQTTIDDQTPLGGNPGNQNTNDNNANGNNANAAGDGSTTIKDETPLSAVNTSDANSVLVWALAGVTALAGTVVIKKKMDNE